MEGTTTVGDVMTREFLGVSEGDPVAGVVSLLVDDGGDCAVVLRGDAAVGLVRDRDVLAAVADDADLAATTAGSLAVEPGPTVPAEGALAEAAAAMAAAGRRVLLVTEDGSPAGVVTARDLATAPAALGPTGEPTDSPNPDAAPDPAPTDPASGLAAGEDPAAYSTQSVCERCGALAGDLRNFNGQLVCADCREA